ncbi:ATP-binding cassette domain-containing protein [uncultured Methanomethylovorans sp.]|uniref:ABC transporter ATP-binding protein n=1 Tax=uncultured Methanomethylovorans sp. TaxID=183759 RepID=UPI002AA65FD9|nr:ATP-binding cassette domain-containing protein [uncultured Methanomethylovorans sp.]
MQDSSNHSDTGHLIDFRNITVTRSGKKLLDSISLQIGVAENVAIIGPNGSGKSSLIKTITREYRPLVNSPSVACRIMGKERWDIFDLQNLLGIVSGDLQHEYTRDIYGYEAVLSGFFSSIGVYKNHRVTYEMKCIVQTVMDFLEISHLQDKSISQMSTGEARRILIARALVHDPLALVLDEPTNSLDLYGLHKFREVMRRIAAVGKSIILVTHNLQDIIPEIERVILFKDGSIFMDGPKEQILTSSNLSLLFGLPVEVQSKGEYYRAWC